MSSPRFSYEPMTPILMTRYELYASRALPISRAPKAGLFLDDLDGEWFFSTYGLCEKIKASAWCMNRPRFSNQIIGNYNILLLGLL